MLQKLSTVWLLILLFALPTMAFAEGEAFNPPGWVGAGMFFLALILPIGVGFWVRNRKHY
jgi:hypothetical protein